MPIFSGHENIMSAHSSISSNSPAASYIDQEEPKKKGIVLTSLRLRSMADPYALGARGGKRSVTHLSKAQLARKRANDREAQRNIRQRTKERIETLERKVKEMEEGSRAGNIERVLARNRELEDEIENLRAQLSVQPLTPGSLGSNSQDIPDDLLRPQKAGLEWMSRSNSTWPQSSPSSHMEPLESEGPVLSPYTNNASMYSTAPLSTNEYNDEKSEALPRMYTQAMETIPNWNDPLIFGPQGAQSPSLTKQTSAWAPFHVAYAPRYADLQQTSFAEVINSCDPSFPATTNWQRQTPA